MSGKTIARIVFWSLFLPASVIFGIYAWNKGVLQQCERNLKLLSHPNARVATEAWLNLNNLYYTKWEAYDILLDHVNDATPINFLIETDTRPVPGQASQKVFLADNKPIFYKTDQVYCRTTGEAILAFVYNEYKWKTDYQGDWKEWWEKNKGWYGRP